MNRIAKSLGPPLTILTIVACLCWSHLEPSESLEPTPPRLPRLSKKALQPEIPTRATRSPFENPSVEEEAVDPVELAKLQKKRIAAEEDARLARQRTAIANLAAGLTLNGAIVGRNPQAIINQSFYGEGDSLSVHGASMRIVEIQANAVVLQHPTATIQLRSGHPAKIEFHEIQPSVHAQKAGQEDRRGLARWMTDWLRRIPSSVPAVQPVSNSN